MMRRKLFSVARKADRETLLHSFQQTAGGIGIVLAQPLGQLTQSRHSLFGLQLPGGQMFNKIDKNKMSEDMVAAAMWLKSRPDCTGKIGATGFCYGGSTANMLAVRLGADLAAAAPFYGGPPAPEDIPKIKAAILVHHGELDTRLAASWPAYDKAVSAANVPREGYIYPAAGHGFNCDAT